MEKTRFIHEQALLAQHPKTLITYMEDGYPLYFVRPTDGSDSEMMIHYVLPDVGAARYVVSDPQLLQTPVRKGTEEVPFSTAADDALALLSQYTGARILADIHTNRHSYDRHLRTVTETYAESVRSCLNSTELTPASPYIWQQAADMVHLLPLHFMGIQNTFQLMRNWAYQGQLTWIGQGIMRIHAYHRTEFDEYMMSLQSMGLERMTDEFQQGMKHIQKLLSRLQSQASKIRV